MAVAYKGGKCVRCGYCRCIDALDFHHTDPSQKDFAISDNVTRSWSAIKAELGKCELLCANCHREVHHALAQRGDPLQGANVHSESRPS